MKNTNKTNTEVATSNDFMKEMNESVIIKADEKEKVTDEKAVVVTPVSAKPVTPVVPNVSACRPIGRRVR